jgi:hypothetical protein
MAEENESGFLSRILTIVAFVIVAVIVIWGLIHIVKLLSVNNKQTASAATLRVVAPAQAISGTPITVSWTYATKTAGSYAFIYPCSDSLKFATADARTIPCGAAFITGTSSISVIPMLSSDKAVSAPLTILFLPGTAGSSQAQGSATVAVSPAATTTPPVVAQPSMPAQPAPVQNSPGTAGPADLTVSIVSATADQYGNGTVVFDIRNVGGEGSGTYYFTAQLPTSSSAQGYGGTMDTGYTYVSPAQSSLSPGSHIVSTLRFTQAVSGVFNVAVGIQDANQGNNYASATLSGAAYNNNYNYQPTYNSQPYYQPYVY